MTARFDAALALRQIGEVAVADSTPILTLGAGLVTLPALLGAVAPGHSAGTVFAVLSGLGAALFATLVSSGTTARLLGKPLGAQDYFRRSIIASPPGFSVALLLGAAGVLAAIVHLIAGAATPAGLTVSFAAAALVVTGLIVLLPAIPVALAERCAPFAALARAARLTRGNRLRIGVLLAVAALAIGPAAALLATPSQVASGLPPGAGASPLSDARLWVWLLFELLAAGIVATVPAVVYVQLRVAR